MTANGHLISELRDQHRKLWLWLAQNPGKPKYSWPGWDTEEVRKLIARFPQIDNDKCFACFRRLLGQCGPDCPVQQWIPGQHNREGIACFRYSALFYDWYNLTDRVKFLRKIHRRIGPKIPARLTSLALHIAFAWK